MLVLGAVLSFAVSGPPAPAAAAASSCDRVAWSGQIGGDHEILVAAADGTSRLPLTNNSVDDRLPAWSPDGDRLAWLAGSDDAYSLTIADDEGDDAQPVGDDATYIDPHHVWAPAWSPDGERLLWARSGIAWWDQSIWLVDAEGDNPILITDPDLGYDRVYGMPAWLPDGSGLAFSGEIDGGDVLILTADIDGGDRTAVSTVSADPDPGTSEEPVVSPDGTMIAWVATAPGLSGQYVFVSNIDGTGRLALTTTDAEFNEHPAWSPDGTRIAWARNGAIVVADRDGGNRVEISSVGIGDDPSANQHPAWSPDGSQLAWSGDDASNVRQIWVSDFDGGDRTEISSVSFGTDPVENHTPVWAPTPAISLTTDGAIDEIGMVGDLTLVADAPCVITGVQIAVEAPPCLDADAVVVSTGSYASGIWTIPTLDGEATLNIEGTPTAGGACTTIAEVVTSDQGAIFSSIVHGDPCISDPHPFTDVLASSFAFEPVGCIFELGITNGTSSTTYSPGNDVTREQMASFLARIWRGLGRSCTDDPHPFTDVPATSFAVDDVGCIFDLGITTGTSVTTYSPQNTVTREQMAAFVARLWRALGFECSPYPHPFTDVDETSFAFDDVGCIFDLAITNGTSATTYSPDLNVTRAQMAAFLERLWRAAVLTP
ncbi:MAG: S-layer homology domain-containing protein [Actinomycetota bacterium]